MTKRRGRISANSTDPRHASADAGVYDSDARALYAALATTDKRLQFIKADHYLTEPAGARDEAADLIAAWVADH